MVGLIDIAPAVETVTVRGKPVEVYGVSASGIAYLLRKYPELRMLMSGMSIEQDKLFALGGEVVPAIIAAGCGHPGSADHEKAAAMLGVSEQFDLLAAILKLTMPGGPGPFVERLQNIAGAVGMSDQSGSGRGMKSPKRSKHSLPTDTTSVESGTLPQDS
jgi:hypothetical protein